MNKLHLFLLLFISLLQSATIGCSDVVGREKKDIKILVLIVASDDCPVYIELQKIWRSYMHYDPERVEAYFIRGNPNLPTLYEIQDDVIWCKFHENLNPGMINKTILSMWLMLPRIGEFDYILRTNLSSFYVFPRLLEFLKHCPKNNFYGGSDNGDPRIGSGCGFLLSPDVVQLMVRNRKLFINNASMYEDELVGHFLINNGQRLFYHDRMDLMPIAMWDYHKDKIPNDMFHYRIRNVDHLRLKDDIYVHKQLLKMFYGIDL